MATPGPFTFILEATKEVPRRVSHPSRRTIGLRVPDHTVLQRLLEQLGQPLLATTLIPPGETQPIERPGEIRARFEKSMQAIVDAGACPMRADDGRRPDAATSRCWCGAAAATRRCSG